MDNEKLVKLAQAVIDGLMFNSKFANANISISDLLSSGTSKELVQGIGQRVQDNLNKTLTNTFGAVKSSEEEKLRRELEIISIIYDIKVEKENERLEKIAREAEKAKKLKNLGKIEDKKEIEKLEKLSLEEIQQKKRQLLDDDF
jgi:hypothetical protein